MFYINETLRAYNWFAALAISIMGDNGLNAWTARAKVIPNLYELDLVKMESKNDKIDMPFNITIEKDDKPLYHIHIYIDDQHKWQDNYRNESPIVIRLRTGIAGIIPIVVVVLHEDIMKFEIDSDKFESIAEMDFEMREYYKTVFCGICDVHENKGFVGIDPYNLCKILASIYLSRFTIFDIEECTKYDIKEMAEYHELTASFYEDSYDESIIKKKHEFYVEQYKEEVTEMEELIKYILNEYTVELNPQIRKESEFIDSFANYMDYNLYRENYEQIKLREIIRPESISV